METERKQGLYDVKNYHFEVPQRLIAQYPAVPRDASRLLFLDRATGAVENRVFQEIINYLKPGDTLVLNESRVIPARLQVIKSTGAQIEILLLQPRGPCWEALVKPAKRIKAGTRLYFPANEIMEIMVLDELEMPGGRLIEFLGGDVQDYIQKVGVMPLPPYINRAAEERDKESYQTVFAKHDGSVAAPTAGLHFSPDLLDRMAQKGIQIVKIVLHVGLGTFRPVQVADIRDHKMHRESYFVNRETAAILNRSKSEGRKIIAVGTTVARTLETVYNENHGFSPGAGSTDKFIIPGYTFKAINGILTNFHLPGSTLIMLVSAFAGREKILKAYQHAVHHEYRFYSYGDAMLII